MGVCMTAPRAVIGCGLSGRKYTSVSKDGFVTMLARCVVRFPYDVTLSANSSIIAFTFVYIHLQVEGMFTKKCVLCFYSGLCTFFLCQKLNKTKYTQNLTGTNWADQSKAGRLTELRS